MTLYSMHVEHEGESFSAQFASESAEDAVRSFFAHPVAKSISPALGLDDVIYVTPMTGLVNLWAACAGRDGRYVRITIVMTAETREC